MVESYFGKSQNRTPYSIEKANKKGLTKFSLKENKGRANLILICVKGGRGKSAIVSQSLTEGRWYT
ncbi:MAG: hypothetical protein NWF00_07840 [Candidatus Bathyarchaeota archaeon]|nr:hypothetical protein [Candidatus Bathyarchaeota archaeon]